MMRSATATSTRIYIAVQLLLSCCVWGATCAPASASIFKWRNSIGTASSSELGTGVSADGIGSVYIAGITSGSLDGTNHGGSDTYVSKFGVTGNHIWTRQLGSAGFDACEAISTDGFGNVYVTGYTDGLLGTQAYGNNDAFLSKYSAAGVLQWTRQLGNSSYQQSYGVSADGIGNIYIAGYTEGKLGDSNFGGGDAFVSKYNSVGSWQWTKQFGTSSYDQAYGVSVDGAGNAYVSGYTEGNLEGAATEARTLSFGNTMPLAL